MAGHCIAYYLTRVTFRLGIATPKWDYRTDKLYYLLLTALQCSISVSWYSDHRACISVDRRKNRHGHGYAGCRWVEIRSGLMQRTHTPYSSWQGNKFPDWPPHAYQHHILHMHYTAIIVAMWEVTENSTFSSLWWRRKNYGWRQFPNFGSIADTIIYEMSTINTRIVYSCCSIPGIYLFFMFFIGFSVFFVLLSLQLQHSLLTALQCSISCTLCHVVHWPELVSLGGRIDTDAGCTGSRRVERTV